MTSATYPQLVAVPSRLVSAAQVAAVLMVLGALSLPLLVANVGPLTAGESRLVSESVSLAAGNGYADPTGALVTDRAPLVPTLLAADFSVAGFSMDHARLIPRLAALGGAVLLLATGWRLFGREAGMLAAATGLVSSLLMASGTSIQAEGVQSLFLLLTLFLLHRAFMAGQPRFAAMAGASLGLSVLTKESAVLWIPLPLLAIVLLGPAVDRPRALFDAYLAGLLSVAVWWWVYVFVITGRIHLLGTPAQAAPWLALGFLCLAAAALAADVFARDGQPRRLAPQVRWSLVGFLLTAWVALFIAGMERSFPTNYLSSVPAYASGELAAWLRPLPFVALAWAHVAHRAARGSLGDRLLLLGLLLMLPVALYAADRDLPASELLPLAFLSFLALSRAVIDFARWLADAGGEKLTPAAGGALAAALVVGAFVWFALGETQHFADYRSESTTPVAGQTDWDGPLAASAAGWIKENVPAGTPIMSGRLYASHLFSLTGARYPWSELPMVRAEVLGNPPAIVRADALVSDQGAELREGVAEPWLYLRRNDSEPYYVGLSEPDLLAEVEERQIGYLILTGDDGSVSSLSLLPYFEAHPAFHEEQSFISDESNQVHIFRVFSSPLLPLAAPAAVSASTAESLRDELGPERAEHLLTGLSPGGYVLTQRYGSAVLADEGS